MASVEIAHVNFLHNALDRQQRGRAASLGDAVRCSGVRDIGACVYARGS